MSPALLHTMFRSVTGFVPLHIHLFMNLQLGKGFHLGVQ